MLLALNLLTAAVATMLVVATLRFVKEPING